MADSHELRIQETAAYGEGGRGHTLNMEGMKTKIRKEGWEVYA